MDSGAGFDDLLPSEGRAGPRPRASGAILSYLIVIGIEIMLLIRFPLITPRPQHRPVMSQNWPIDRFDAYIPYR